MYQNKFICEAMLPRRVRSILNLHDMITYYSTANLFGIRLKHHSGMYSAGSISTELPRKCKKCERKPWVTHINELKRMARRERKERQMVKEKILGPPENGLLVKELIPVAHDVFAARTELLACVTRVAKSIAIYTCRIGRAVSHNERLEVDQIPAVNELCIQAGIDIPQYPTRRRVFPAYNLAAVAVRGMETWGKMRSGISKLMQKYAVQTCGYCPEVQVGPKGHRVRNCQAYKHQMRDGQHAWQEATVDDLVPPVYVWHVQDPKSGKPLVNELKRYYGMLPAVVELFAQAGAKVSCDYTGLMREDVALPELDEEKWVV
ncbi:APO protein 3 mitochondrial [Citrus sinensis]|nr:APO protein 3 mitochondrial [Citrus sinensis]